MDIGIEVEDRDFFPFYGSDLAAGADVKAYIEEDVVIQPGESALISTGIKMEIPEGYEIQIRPRSGLALKQQITVLNTPGTIDADYRGTVKVILINHGKLPFVVTRGMRIAQIILARAYRAAFVEREMSATVRGSSGFGHTGTH